MKEKIRRCFAVIYVISVFIGCALLIPGVISIEKGLNNVGDSAIAVAEANAINAGATELLPEEATFELEARIVNNDYRGDWYHDVISLRLFEEIEVRLKASSAYPKDITSGEIYRYGLSMAPTAGLGWNENATWRRVTMSDGSSSDYLENYDSPNVQYYYIGTFYLNFGEWLHSEATPTVEVWNRDFGATMFVVPPYDLPQLWMGINIAVTALILMLVIPFLTFIVEVIVLRRYADK